MNDQFETHRSFLVGLAYRMLGSVAEAEDVVQDAYVRWSEVDHASVTHPRAYLARVVSRLCLDRMKSATSRREQYVGMWLPEPLVAAPSEPIADDLSIALLLTLERLSPLERAAFLLHDVFDMDYGVIAQTLGRTEAACRQLAARARDHVREQRPRYSADETTREKLADAFHSAVVTGDVDAFARMLADDATFYSDGGGKRSAALNPIFGKDKIVRFLEGLRRKGALLNTSEVERVQINGMPGFILRTADGIEALSFESSGEQVVAIYYVRNPDKLRHLA
jgi:RNA polymerase sigma-70 factor (ECF subfamily)